MASISANILISYPLFTFLDCYGKAILISFWAYVKQRAGFGPIFTGGDKRMRTTVSKSDSLGCPVACLAHSAPEALLVPPLLLIPWTQ